MANGTRLQLIVTWESEVLSSAEHYQVHDLHGERVIELVNVVFVIIIIIIIIIIFIITIIISFMQDIYTYIPETNSIPREYSVAGILLLLFLFSSSSSSPLCRVFILIFLRQTMSLGNTVLQVFCCCYFHHHHHHHHLLYAGYLYLYS